MVIVTWSQSLSDVLTFTDVFNMHKYMRVGFISVINTMMLSKWNQDTGHWLRGWVHYVVSILKKTNMNILLFYDKKWSILEVDSKIVIFIGMYNIGPWPVNMFSGLGDLVSPLSTNKQVEQFSTLKVAVRLKRENIHCKQWADNSVIFYP